MTNSGQKKKKDGEGKKKRRNQSALIQYGGVQIRRGGHENCVDGTAARVRLSIWPNQIISNAGETASYLPSPQPQTFLCRPPRSLREPASLHLLETKRVVGGVCDVGSTSHSPSLKSKGIARVSSRLHSTAALHSVWTRSLRPVRVEAHNIVLSPCCARGGQHFFFKKLNSKL